MSIHPNRDLIYDLSIPLAQLQIGLDFKKPLAYNVKIISLVNQVPEKMVKNLWVGVDPEVG